MLTAKDARGITEQSIQRNIMENQVQPILEKIRKQAELGGSELLISEDLYYSAIYHIKELGFNVVEHEEEEMGFCISSTYKISW